MGQTHQTPLTSNMVQATQQKPAKTTRFFDLTKHRFHDHFAPGIQGSPCGRPHFRCPARLGRGGRLSLLSLRDMGSLTARGPSGQPQRF
jgi:hypothetical protein